jgi:hypoxanthine phosphoribosyltransferase
MRGEPSPTVEILFSAATVHAEVSALGRRLGDELADEDPLLVALLGGSVIFLADLVRAISRPVRYEFIDVAYSQGLAPGVPGSPGTPVEGVPVLLNIRYPIPIEIAGQSVLVLKDVVSSAVTEPYLTQQLRDHGARQVRFAALIDMPSERKTEFHLDYAALTTERRGLLVGYGMKHQGLWGNLPYVGRLSAGAAGAAEES